MKVYFNGQFVDESEARVSIFDHGLLYGDGIFEGIRAYSRRIFKLEEHMNRLYQSAKAIDLQIPLPIGEMTKKTVELCKLNNVSDAYLRPLITRGIGDMGLDPRKCGKPTTLIIAREMKPLLGEGELTLITSFWRRNSPDALNPNIKSLNYLNNILAKIEASRHGADDCVFLDREGYVSEGSAENIFAVKDTALITPPTLTNLRGITRATAIEMAAEKGYIVREENLSLFDLYNADEVFLCGTAAEIAPVTKIDGRTVGEGKMGDITHEIRVAYIKRVNSEGVPF